MKNAYPHLRVSEESIEEFAKRLSHSPALSFFRTFNSLTTQTIGENQRIGELARVYAVLELELALELKKNDVVKFTKQRNVCMRERGEMDGFFHEEKNSRKGCVVISVFFFP